MKKSIWLIGIMILFCPWLVLGDECPSGEEEICENPSSSCGYTEGINASCHYDCTETSMLVIPGPVLGSDKRGILAGTGFAFPFKASTNYVCTIVMHPEDPGPEPSIPSEPNESDYMIEECETCCDDCPEPEPDDEDDGRVPNPGYRPECEYRECNPPTGAGCCDYREETCPSDCVANLFVKPPAAKPLINTKKSPQVVQIDNCLCGSHQCNCHDVLDEASYNSAVADYEAAVAAWEEWKANYDRIQADLAECSGAGSSGSSGNDNLLGTDNKKKPEPPQVPDEPRKPVEQDFYMYTWVCEEVDEDGLSYEYVCKKNNYGLGIGAAFSDCLKDCQGKLIQQMPVFNRDEYEKALKYYQGAMYYYYQELEKYNKKWEEYEKQLREWMDEHEKIDENKEQINQCIELLKTTQQAGIEPYVPSEPRKMDYCVCDEKENCSCTLQQELKYNEAKKEYDIAVKKHEEWQKKYDEAKEKLKNCRMNQYHGTVEWDASSAVSMTIEEKQNGKDIGHHYSYGELLYQDGSFIVEAPYIHKTTGEIVYHPVNIDFYESAYYYRGDHYYYTDIMTQPGCFDIKVSVNQVGQNCKVNLSTDCYYKVRNKYYCVEEECEEEKTGKGLQYVFRQINLTDVFPNGRDPRWNWSCGATNTLDKSYPVTPVNLTEDIESKGYSIYETSNNEVDSSSELDYEITLTPKTMRRIRQYNRKQGSYLNYDDYCYQDDRGRNVCSSNFLHRELPKYGDNILSKTGLIGCNNQKDATTCDTSINIDSCYGYFRGNGYSDEDCKKIAHEVYID